MISLNFACGKRKPPLPPIERVSQRAEISGVQQGNVISLTWALPDQNPNDTSSQNISRVDVYRLTEIPNAPLILTEEEFASRSVLISTLDVSEEDFQKKSKSFNDILEFNGQNIRVRYAVRFVNASGQKAAFSNFLVFEPTARIARNPENLSAQVEAESIQLSWKKPVINIDNSTPPNILGFNIYRSDDLIEQPVIINKTPVSESVFQDKSFEFNRKYRYFVRAISLGANGEPVESLNSNIVEVQPKDTFAPQAPTALTIAAAPNNLSIFFAANSEKDLAGYRVYRSETRELSIESWENLTANLLTTNTFQDKNVVSGKTYFYYIVAVDDKGNTSPPSEIVSETAP